MNEFIQRRIQNRRDNVSIRGGKPKCHNIGLAVKGFVSIDDQHTCRAHPMSQKKARRFRDILLMKIIQLDSKIFLGDQYQHYSV